MIQTRAGRRGTSDDENMDSFFVKIKIDKTDNITVEAFDQLVNRLSTVFTTLGNRLYSILFLGDEPTQHPNFSSFLNSVASIEVVQYVGVYSTQLVDDNLLNAINSDAIAKTHFVFTYNMPESEFDNFCVDIDNIASVMTLKPTVLFSNVPTLSGAEQFASIKTGSDKFYYLDGTYYSAEELLAMPDAFNFYECMCAPLLEIRPTSQVAVVRPACGQKQTIDMSVLFGEDIFNYLKHVVCNQTDCNINSMLNTKYSLLEYKRLVDSDII